MTCEICGSEATHVDGSAVDIQASGYPHGPTAHREMRLCPVHAADRRESNTSRVRCLHVRLDEDGICRTCGADCR